MENNNVELVLRQHERRMENNESNPPSCISREGEPFLFFEGGD